MTVDHSIDASQQRLLSLLESFLVARPLLFRVVARIVRPDEVEDIVQETFLRSHAAARDHTIHSPVSFMVKTARNLSFNYIDRSERKLQSSLDELIEGDSVMINEALMTPQSMETQYHWKEKYRVFCEAVAELPNNCRRVFILRKAYGLSQNEVAEYLAISSSTVEKHVAKGMLMVGNYMLKNGHQISPNSKGYKIGNREYDFHLEERN